ncbi:hypothetical protein WG904_05100 [Pedobacter sp. Du54]|uniref:hypothetical protein n=1 Tax=Pedobacter anseongensis TaxID=3133439 RepID=UPI0030AF0A16
MLSNLKYFITICLLTLLIISGCTGEQDKKRLDDRERSIERRESEVARREQQLKASEKLLMTRMLQLDSANNLTDSNGVYNANIVGAWKVTMQCTETTCTGYAVGDTKTEQWNITYENNRVVVKAYAKKKFIRTYNGIFSKNAIELTADQPELKIHLDVTLAPEGGRDELMTGHRTISKEENECRTVFGLKAEKI